MALVLSVDSRGQDGTLIEFRYLNSKSGFWPFQLHIFAPLGSTRSFCQLVHHINKVNLQFSKKVEKRVTYISDFFQLFYVKSDMLRLYTSNTIPNNSLRPLLFDFMIFILSPLSAILTQNGTNVPPPPKKKGFFCFIKFLEMAKSNFVFSDVQLGPMKTAPLLNKYY